MKWERASELTGDFNSDDDYDEYTKSTAEKRGKIYGFN